MEVSNLTILKFHCLRLLNLLIAREFWEYYRPKKSEKKFLYRYEEDGTVVYDNTASNQQSRREMSTYIEIN